MNSYGGIYSTLLLLFPVGTLLSFSDLGELPWACFHVMTDFFVGCGELVFTGIIERKSRRYELPSQ